MENEKSSKSSLSILKTKFQQLGYVFGSQLTDFDTNVLPKECDVISVWISKVRNICKMFYFVPSKKPSHQRKTFLNDKIYSYTMKKPFGTL